MTRAWNVGLVVWKRPPSRVAHTMPAPPILEIRNLFCTIGVRDILREVSLTVFEGETVVLLGRSGSGKTTLLKAVNGLIRPTAGAIHFEGKPAAEWDPIRLRRRMGYVKIG